MKTKKEKWYSRLKEKHLRLEILGEYKLEMTAIAHADTLKNAWVKLNKNGMFEVVREIK